MWYSIWVKWCYFWTTALSQVVQKHVLGVVGNNSIYWFLIGNMCAKHYENPTMISDFRSESPCKGAHGFTSQWSLSAWDRLYNRFASVCLCLSVCEHSHGRISWSILISSSQVRRYNTVLIISTAPELMKLFFAVLDVSLTMDLTHCYKTECFLHLYLQFLYIVHAISIRYTRLKRRKSICILNFDEIPQSMAEIKLLPVSDDGCSYFGILLSISILNYSVCVIMRMSCCIRMRNFVIIGQTSADFWRHVDFSRWRS